MIFRLAVLCVCLLTWRLETLGQSLSLPARSPEAPNGSELVGIMERMPRDQREAWVWNEVLAGNVPSWNRTFLPVSFVQSLSGTNCTVTLKVLPEYIALGSDTNYFLCPMTPLLAQRLADRLGCVLPTRKMVNVIWTNSPVKLSPQPIPPSGSMTTVPVFADHNTMVRQQRDQHTNAHPYGTLVSGHKKDVVISVKIYTNFATAVRRPVVIYGWHYTSGSPIQPLYNGHEETYADYSHGVRLVHSQVLIGGISQSITGVLTNPALAYLLNDETPAEGATNGVMPNPRYQPPGVAPAILKHPRSTSLRPGDDLLLSVVAAGDEPLGYEWRLNNAIVPSQHAASLAISNAADTDAGSWTVKITNAVGALTSRAAVVRVRASQFPVLFCEDFEPGGEGAWRQAWGASNGISDYAADLRFEHTLQPAIIRDLSELIPAAPNSVEGHPHAARLSVNAKDSLGAVCAANFFCPGAFSNDFVLKFDCWINYPGGAGGINSTGSTQHALFGLNHSGSLAAWSGAVPADGLWFAMSGEGGDSRDYRAYAGAPGGATELIGVQSGLSASNNTAVLFQGLFPSSRFETPGAPGKQWIEIELWHSNNVVVWKCDGTTLASRLNTSPFQSGAIMLGLQDFFPSIANPAQDSFVLFDNVRIEDLSGQTRVLEASCADGEFRMVFSAIPGRRYVVRWSIDLLEWTEGEILTSTCGPIGFLDAPLAARRFYKIEGPLPLG